MTPPLQFEPFLFVIVALQVARKIASCNMAFRFSEENYVAAINAVPQCVVSRLFLDVEDVTEAFDDHREVQIDEFKTQIRMTRNQILKNI